MPQADKPVERRHHPRTSLQLPVKYKAGEMQKERFSHTLDVSLGGLFLASDQALVKGALIRMDLTLPKISRMISAYAEVVWTNGAGGGLHFEAMQAEDENTLKNYLSNLPEEKSFNRIST